MSARRYTALVLAGRRGGSDPVAAAAGVSHKALARIGGTTLIERVLGALRDAASVADILVATDDAGVAALAVGCTAVPTAGSPALTVAEVLRGHPSLLVTTADHGMLSATLVDRFCSAIPERCDVAAGIVPRRAFTRELGGRTFYRLADDDYCGANLYAFVGPGGVAAARFWAALEGDRKMPWRLAARIGPSTLLRYATRRLDLPAAFALLSRHADAGIAPVVLDDPDAAIDVDTPADLEIVRRRFSGSRRCGRSP